MKTIYCSYCNKPVPPAYYNTPGMILCPQCNTPVKIDVFPVFFRNPEPGKAGESLIDDQAGCFYHPRKKAVVLCDHCGRFLCALCDVELDHRHICPSCLESEKKRGSMVSLERHRVLYDHIALKLSLYPVILMVWFTFITAPAALYLSIKHWNSPVSIVSTGRYRFVLAIIFSGIQILGWITGMLYLVL